ncbi:Holliday junction resolvase RuvX [Corticibacter populi]|uniref:Putative pre-16S rRNA nuclease n=1 Tax=Corticibacter populi TaxID=1550736 RepID=A0A3M6QQ23_9BURK|nr:Holliday junction resolvase RuvX [Corticibacter populi]RMX04901.1 Holliday junction resolvase RuvX [Corticibacter populi]RZS33676.1 putative Holliday junction resolvase [Corticibacter populi]
MPENMPPDASVQAHWQTFLAFDYGTRRTGVAVGTRMLGSANPVGTLAAEGKAQFPLAAAYLDEWRPDALVVGIPFHPDGAEHENTLRARKFMRGLHGRFGLPVFGVDERYSTTEALAGGADERQVDAQSAAIILAQFLRSLE